MTQPLMIEAFSAPSLRGTGALVDGAFALPENQTAKGMGQLFSSTNISTWGIGEWAAIAIGGYLAVSLFQDSKSVAGSVGRTAGRAKRGVKRAAAGSTTTIGQVAIVAGLAFAGYLAYQYFQNPAAATPVPAATGALIP